MTSGRNFFPQNSKNYGNYSNIYFFFQKKKKKNRRFAAVKKKSLSVFL